jgi:hypothetical protein
MTESGPVSLEWIFQYHKPTEDQIPRYERLRAAALEFSKVIEAECPNCADRTAAIRKVREAVMTANAAIAIYTRRDYGRK